MPKPLIFIDANIFLDFYRQPAGNTGLSLLEKVNDHHDAIITGDQVEMEFKKNRQKVIQTFHSQMKVSGANFPLPAFLAGSKQEEALQALRKRLEKHAEDIKVDIAGVLKDPHTADPVFRVAEKLFRADTELSLSRKKPERKTIRELAEKRFELGYPPRKPDDTSIGDAINWEWMLACVEKLDRDLIIVTRDRDFGVALGDGSILNDWLQKEFTDRTKRNRSVTLTERLADAFAAISVPVSKEEVAQENALIAKLVPDQNLVGWLQPDDWWVASHLNSRTAHQIAASIIANSIANQGGGEELPIKEQSQE
jgi:hypothetical protein